jgi:hypothetical protein
MTSDFQRKSYSKELLSKTFSKKCNIKKCFLKEHYSKELPRPRWNSPKSCIEENFTGTIFSVQIFAAIWKQGAQILNWLNIGAKL